MDMRPVTFICHAPEDEMESIHITFAAEAVVTLRRGDGKVGTMKAGEATARCEGMELQVGDAWLRCFGWRRRAPA